MILMNSNSRNYKT